MFTVVDTPPASRLSDALESLLHRLHGRSQSELFNALIELDLSFTQAKVLFTLAKHGVPMQINEVAEDLAVSLATAGRNVDQLMGLGLVHRREGVDDRRIKLVTMTEAGREIALTYENIMHAQICSFVHEVPPVEATTLADAINNALAGADLLAADSQDFAR